jgi:hypothetical protein
MNPSLLELAGARPVCESPRLPRVLILSYTIPETAYAGSIVLYRLLETYPPERLLVLGPRPSSQSELLDCRYETIEGRMDRLHRTRLARLSRSVETFGITPGLRLSRAQGVLKGFRPQVVVTDMLEQSYFMLAYRFAVSYNLPLMVFINDLPGIFEKVYAGATKRQAQRNQTIYRYARKRIAISPEMSTELERIYGATGDFLYPMRSNYSARPITENRALKENGKLRIAFVGSLAYGRRLTLSRLVRVCQKVQAQIRIYSHDVWPETKGGSTVINCGMPQAGVWERVKEECDVVMLPYPWTHETGYEPIHETSFPSKLPVYLALGMPLLIIGPPTALGVQWGLRNPDAALTVADNQPDAWGDALTSLKESAALREGLARQGILAGSRDFDPMAIREEFLQHLSEAAAADPVR